MPFSFALLLTYSLTISEPKPTEVIDSLLSALRYQFAIGQVEDSQLAKRILKMSYESNYLKGVARSLNSIAIIQYSEGKIDSAEVTIHQSLQLSSMLNDDHLLTECYWFLGGICNLKANYTQAYKNLSQALDHALRVNDENVGKIYQGLSLTFDAMGNYELALKYINHALTVDKNSFPNQIQKLNLLYRLHREDDAATEMLMIRKTKSKSDSIPFQALIIEASLAANRGEVNSVSLLHHLEKVTRKWSNPPHLYLTQLYLSLANYYARSQYDSAKYYLNIAFPLLPTQDKALCSEYFEILARVNAHLGSYREAYSARQRYDSLRESSGLVAALNEIHEIDLYRLEKARVKERELYTARIESSNKNLLIVGLLGLGILLLGILVSIFFIRLKKLHTILKERNRKVVLLNTTLEERVLQRTSELSESLQKVNERNAALEKIAWTYSHEFRAPFARLEGLLKVLTLDFSPESLSKASPMVQMTISEIKGVIKTIVDNSASYVSEGTSKVN